jgi:hypothetical protein
MMVGDERRFPHENPDLRKEPYAGPGLWCLLHEQGHCVCGIARATTDCLERVARHGPIS